MRPERRWCVAIAIMGLGWSAALAAQQRAAISGRVVSQDGEPLAQATVIIERLGVGTVTRGDGRYLIQLPAARLTGDTVTLMARLIGYKPQVATITLEAGDITRDFSLAANPLQLGEIVVTGAGTVSEVEKLGTVRSFVDSSTVVNSGEQNFSTALAAKAPGVVVTSSSGDPGASAFIQIRGLTTISAQDGQPLLVVDGVPVDNSISYNNPVSGSLNSSSAPPNRAIDLNPNDIENVEILKGAASGSIYGSRAGQGVILITTKRGRPGATRYSMRSSVSVDAHGRLPELQRKYGLGRNGAPPACVSGAAVNCAVGFNEAGSWGPLLASGTPTFGHAGEMFQDGYTLDNALTISGGTERTTFYLSGEYSNNRGIVVGPNNSYRRISVRFNGSHRVFDNLKLSANVAYIDGDGGAVVSRNSTDGLLLGAWRTPPNFNNRPYLDPVTGLQRTYRFPNPGVGSEQTGRRYDNPFFVANEAPSTTNVGRVLGGVTTDFTATPWLSFSHTLGYDYANDERLQGYPWSTSNTTIAGVTGIGGVNAGYIKSSQLDHNLLATAKVRLSPGLAGSFTLGQNLNVQNFQSRQVVGVGLIAPKPFNLGNTAARQAPYDFRSTVRLESYFAQVTADIGDQLFLKAGVRNDGGSTFGAAKRRAWYPNATAAWTFYRGAVGENKLLTYGKLRTAYGQSGTQPAPYLLPSVFVSVNGNDGGWGPAIGSGQNGSGGLVTSYNLPGKDLGPERVKEFEAGFDVGLWRDKADLSVTHYRAISSDVILNLPVAGSTGYTETPTNAASLRNLGWEVAFNIRPVSTRDVGVELGLQWARNRSKVLDLAGVAFAPLPFSGGTNGLTGIQAVAIEGQPLGVFYMTDFVRCGRGVQLNYVDIDNVAGQCQGAPNGALYIGSDGYPVKDDAGNYVMGDPNPSWTGSIRPSFRFKKLTIGGLFDIRHGGVAYNGTRGALLHFGTSIESQRLRDGGNKIFGTDYFPGNVAGPGAGMAVPLDEAWFEGAGGVFNGPQAQFLEDASFVKLREISVGYLFDQPWVSQAIGFSSIELRLAARNLRTWTKYTGIDPETSLLGAASAVRGIDYFNNPQTKSFLFSLTFNR